MHNALNIYVIFLATSFFSLSLTRSHSLTHWLAPWLGTRDHHLLLPQRRSSKFSSSMTKKRTSRKSLTGFSASSQTLAGLVLLQLPNTISSESVSHFALSISPSFTHSHSSLLLFFSAVACGSKQSADATVDTIDLDSEQGMYNPCINRFIILRVLDCGWCISFLTFRVNQKKKKKKNLSARRRKLPKSRQRLLLMMMTTDAVVLILMMMGTVLIRVQQMYS